jgi:hypothetical protein
MSENTTNKIDQENQTITISIREYEDLIDDSLFLNALRNAGVDNWEWYGEAIREYEEEKKE